MTLVELEGRRSFVERTIGRELRQAETAVDVLKLDTALEVAKTELEAAIRAEMIQATQAWVAGLAARPAIRITDAMIAPLQDLFRIGREEAALELKRLGYRGTIEPETIRRYQQLPLELDPERDLRAFLRRGVSSIEVRIEDELLNAELGGASRLAIAHALLTVPGARDLAGRVISTALIDGLGATFEANADLIRCWEYTAILDAATCARCRPLDGRKYGSLDELFKDLPNFGPNPLCLGDGRCRCRALPCHVDEAGQNEPFEALLVPEPDLPPWRAELEQIRQRDFLNPADLQRTGINRDDYIVGVRRPMPNRPAGDTWVDEIPGERLLDDEQAILRAGELVDGQIDDRLGDALRELEDAKIDVILQRDGLRARVKEADEIYRQALRDADDAEKALRDRLVDEWKRAHPDRAQRDAWEAFRWANQHDEMVALKARNTERLLPLMKARDVPQNEVYDLGRKLKGIDGQIASARRDALRDVLSEIREIGPGDGPRWEFTTAGRRAKAKVRLDEAADYFPRDWIERGRANPLEVKPWRDYGRGWHSEGRSYSTIQVTGSGRSKVPGDPAGMATAIHELGHHAEWVDPRIRLLEWCHYQRRTRPGSIRAVQEVEKALGSGYGRNEVYRQDFFTESYMGKSYGNSPQSAYELLTMALESVWTGSYELDAELRHFVLGLLATL